MQAELRSVLLLCALSVSGCTAMSVNPVDPALGQAIDRVCILDNPKAQVSDFLPAVLEAFAKRKAATEVFSGARPESCRYVLTYSAYKGWDGLAYLREADLDLFDTNGVRLGSASYRMQSENGAALVKWVPTGVRVDGMVEQLLGRRAAAAQSGASAPASMRPASGR